MLFAILAVLVVMSIIAALAALAVLAVLVELAQSSTADIPIQAFFSSQFLYFLGRIHCDLLFKCWLHVLG